MAELRDLIDQGQVLALDAAAVDGWCANVVDRLDGPDTVQFGDDNTTNPGGPGVPPFEPYTGPGELRMFLDAKLHRLRIIAGEAEPE